MGVYIKDLKVPENCDICPIFLNFTTCGCDRDHCMFQDVPEPHGDLIDRKALMEGEGRYFISICKEGIDVEEILRAKAIIPASEEVE